MPRKNKEDCREYARKWRANCTPEQRAITRKYQNDWIKKNWPRVSILARDAHLRRKYGISEEAVEVIANDQGGRCAICSKMLLLGSHTHIDHNHQSGKIRGLLCVTCNQGLGSFKDRSELLRSTAIYLDRQGK